MIRSPMMRHLPWAALNLPPPVQIRLVLPVMRPLLAPIHSVLLTRLILSAIDRN